MQVLHIMQGKAQCRPQEKKKNRAQLLVQHLFFFLVFTGQNLKINKHRNIPTDKFQRWLLLCRLKSFHSQQKHSACPWHHHDGGSHQSSSSQSGNTKQSVRPDLLVFHFFFSFKKMSLLCTNKPKSERRERVGGNSLHTHTHTLLCTHFFSEALPFLHLFFSLFHSCTMCNSRN